MSIADRPTAEEILVQLGWYDTGTQFCSLNLRPHELEVLQRAIADAPSTDDGRIESQLTAILRDWLSKQHERSASSGNEQRPARCA